MKNRVAYFDILNIIACISVVILHVNGAVHHYVHDDTWWLRCFYEVCFFFAVPIFFMLSGATLISFRERYNLKSYISKRIHRTLIPFLFFSFLYLIFNLYLDYRHDNPIIVEKYVSEVISGTLPMTNYWFFIPLFFLYVFIPFLSFMFEKLDNKKILCLALIIILFQGLIWPLQMRLDLNPSHLPLDGYVAYILLGGAFASKEFKIENKYYKAIFIISILSLVFRYIVLYNSTERNSLIMTYNGIWGYFPAMFIFLWFKKHFKEVSNSGCIRLKKLASCSFGVYLIHGIFVKYISKFIGISDSSVIHTIVIVPIVYISCVIVVSLIKRYKLTSWMM